jgi:hypothetical protein
MRTFKNYLAVTETVDDEDDLMNRATNITTRPTVTKAMARFSNSIQ